MDRTRNFAMHIVLSGFGLIVFLVLLSAGICFALRDRLIA